MVKAISILGSTGSIGRQTAAAAGRLGIPVRAIAANRGIDLLEEQIRVLENQIDVYRSISLVGTQVHMKALGTGVVIQQNVNMIKVRFGDTEKQFIISTKYPMRPTFEDDAEIVEAMTDYEVKLKELDALRKKLAAL